MVETGPVAGRAERNEPPFAVFAPDVHGMCIRVYNRHPARDLILRKVGSASILRRADRLPSTLGFRQCNAGLHRQMRTATLSYRPRAGGST
jgi:hypothetical protein